MGKIGEVKIHIATAIAAAFGFVIALIWKEIIIDLLKRGGLWLNAAGDDPISIIVPIITAIIVTIVCVLGIMYITKWGGVDKK